MDPQSLDDLQTKFVTICMDGEGISMFFSLDDDGVAIVTSLRLSLRFQLNINSLHIDKEIFDVATEDLIYMIGQLPIMEKLSTSYLDLKGTNCMV
jgi:hypothetical protein